MPTSYNPTDPWSGLKNSTNALFALALSEQRNRSVAVDEDRNKIINEKWQDEKVLIPLKHMQAKFEMAKQILPGVRRENYGKLYDWATSGNGAIPKELLPTSDQIAGMDDAQFEGLKRNMFMSADQLGKLPLLELEKTIQESRIKAQEASDLRKAKISEQDDDRTMKRIEAQAALEKSSRQNALTYAQERHKAEMAELQKRVELAGAGAGGGGKRDPRLMDIMNRAQTLIDAKRKIASDPVAMNSPNGPSVLQEIDKELEQISNHYSKLGGDPNDFGMGAQPQQAGGQGGPVAGDRIYVPGKGFQDFKRPGSSVAGVAP